ncbi:diguanylate cyclase (GGDEF) domain-containing protein [Dendrosporobacter quercicolus]|uniref:Diguanylate cyclase (GGDEF) domain-containing protein n=1 Tax=Dendrosporobacter quercicolus TaxID=146817 RepID=A0A1G9RNA9_9FIRM|nr:diguanylate cyclase [Dendrosporobacter quercicolus]SDM24570.1 diguanylate cyclase (GGDEF) domain-containing protein [Dendrosporobacter quercicolus]
MLTLHNILDMTSIVLGFTIFIIAWFNTTQNNNNKFKAAGVAILFATILDLIHLMTSAKMLGSGLPVNSFVLFVLARLIWSCALLYAVYLPAKLNGCRNTSLLYTLLIIVGILMANLIFSSETWPCLLINGYAQSLLPMVLLTAIVPDVAALIILRRHYANYVTANRLQIALLFDILTNAGYALSLLAPFDLDFSIHIFKLLASFYMLQAVFRLVVQYPYEQLVNLKERLEDLVAKNAQLYKESEKQRNLVENALAKIGAIISSQLDLRDTLDAIADMVADMMNSSQSVIALISTDQSQLQVVATYGINTPPSLLPWQHSLGGQVIEINKALYISDLSSQPDMFRPQLIFSNIRSIIAAPLINDGQVIGVIEVYSSETAAYDQHDALFLTALGHHAGAAIASAMLYEETKLRLEEEKFLSEIAQSAAATIDTDTIVEQCSTHAVKALSGDIGIGFLLGNSPDFYRVAAAVNFSCKLPDIALTDYPELNTLVSGLKPVTAPAEVFEPITHSCDKIDVRHIMVLPLAVDQRLLGFLLIGWQRFITPERLKRISFAKIMAQQIALGLEKAHLYNQVKSMALSDGLTGLANRRNFDMFLKTELRRAASLKRPLSLIMLDLDKFKNYNDTYGHLVGDKLLAQIGQILHHNVRNIDLPARYGGEEFSIILPECSSAEATVVAEKLRVTIEQNHYPDNAGAFTARITASLGIATYDPALTACPPDTEKIISIADKALYKAKQQGRNRVISASVLE